MTATVTTTCQRCRTDHAGGRKCTGHVWRCRACGKCVEKENQQPPPAAECLRCGSHNIDPDAPCRNWPRRGQTICGPHGGKAPQNLAAGARRLHAAAIETKVAATIAAYDGVDTVDPLNGLLEVVARTSIWVQLLGAMVGELDTKPEVGDAGGITNAAVYGQNHLGDGAPHVLVDMYGQWLERHARACKLALDAGIDERRIQLQRDQVEIAVTVIRGTLHAFDIDATDPQVGEIIGTQLRLVAGGGAS